MQLVNEVSRLRIGSWGIAPGISERSTVTRTLSQLQTRNSYMQFTAEKFGATSGHEIVLAPSTTKRKIKYLKEKTV
jgi:hypothetical protein